MSSSGGSRGRKAPEEEHENHERWLVTYADMVTLLMVLFIVMFAMSQVDERKFNELKDGLAAGFGAQDSILTGSKSILDQPGVASVNVPAPDEQFAAPAGPHSSAGGMTKMVADGVAKAEQQRQQRAFAEARAEKNRLDEVQKRLRAGLREKGLAADVTTKIDERGLVVSLVSRRVTFEADLAALSPRGERVVDTLAPVLRAIPDALQIDGHTNQVQVQPKFYPTDWDLSAARAITVLRRLQETWGIPGERLTASAFGPEKPLVDPDTKGSQAVNKRVDIIVLTDLPASSSGTLAAVAESDERQQARRRQRATRVTQVRDAGPPETSNTTAGPGDRARATSPLGADR